MVYTKEDLIEIAKKRAGRWFDDVEYEIRFICGGALIILRNVQGNFTDHYTQQLQDHFNEYLPGKKIKVVFWGPVWLDTSLEEDYWPEEPATPKQPLARPRAPWRLEE